MSSESSTRNSVNNWKWSIISLVVFFAYGSSVIYEVGESKSILIESNNSSAFNYVVAAKSNIEIWKVYSEIERNPSKIDPRIEELVSDLMAGLERNKQLEKRIVIDNLSNTWQVYFSYFKAYLLFICADVRDDNLCAKQSFSKVLEVEKLDSAGFTDEQLKWLEDEAIFDHLRILKAYVSAVIYLQLPEQEENKFKAIEALKKLGNKEVLLASQMDKDRILGEIFNLAFTDEDTNK